MKPGFPSPRGVGLRMRIFCSTLGAAALLPVEAGLVVGAKRLKASSSSSDSSTFAVVTLFPCRMGCVVSIMSNWVRARNFSRNSGSTDDAREDEGESSSFRRTLRLVYQNHAPISNLSARRHTASNLEDQTYSMLSPSAVSITRAFSGRGDDLLSLLSLL